MLTPLHAARLACSWRTLGWVALPLWCVACASSHVVPPQDAPQDRANTNRSASAASSHLSMTATVGPQDASASGQIAVRKPVIKTTAAAVAERRVGVVRMIGAGRRFVLIEAAPSAQLALADGQELRCRTSPEEGGVQTALVRVGRERRQQFIAADVIDGQPNAGDNVYLAAKSSSGSSATIPPLISRPPPDRSSTVPGSAARSLFEPVPANP